MTETRNFEVPSSEAGFRIDQVLATHLAGEFSRSQIKRWIEKGNVLLNQKRAKANSPVKGGDLISFTVEPLDGGSLKPSDIPLEIAFEDDDVIVVNKPAGLVVHPGAGRKDDTLVNALLFYTKEKLSQGSHALRPGIVHRLDKDTSGLLIIAKNDWTHERLAKQFKDHTILRTYWVVVKGVVQHDEIFCDESLGKSPFNRKKVIIDPSRGKYSASYFTVKDRFVNATLLEAKLETGRTHQIRVHLKHLGYPVLGDITYGIPSDHISRQALHAKTLEFTHPRTKKRVCLDSHLPPDLASLLEYLKKGCETP